MECGHVRDSSSGVGWGPLINTATSIGVGCGSVRTMASSSGVVMSGITVARTGVECITVVPLLKDTLYRGHASRKDTNSWH